MTYFGVIFFANMGGGGGQNYFQILPRIKGKERCNARIKYTMNGEIVL